MRFQYHRARHDNLFQLIVCFPQQATNMPYVSKVLSTQGCANIRLHLDGIDEAPHGSGLSLGDAHKLNQARTTNIKQ